MARFWRAGWVGPSGAPKGAPEGPQTAPRPGPSFFPSLLGPPSGRPQNGAQKGPILGPFWAPFPGLWPGPCCKAPFPSFPARRAGKPAKNGSFWALFRWFLASFGGFRPKARNWRAKSVVCSGAPPGPQSPSGAQTLWGPKRAVLGSFRPLFSPVLAPDLALCFCLFSAYVAWFWPRVWACFWLVFGPFWGPKPSSFGPQKY